MTEVSITPLTTREELMEFAQIYRNSYPASEETPETLMAEFEESLSDDCRTLWGAWEGGRLLGGAISLDLSLNYVGKIIPVGGIGDLAVDPISRRRGVAGKIMSIFLEQCREKGQSLALLYPFRHDFYSQMGFGYGARRDLYRFRLDALRTASRNPGEIRYVQERDASQLLGCYNRVAQLRHGFCLRREDDFRGLIKEYVPKGRMVGYWERDELKGYLAYRFSQSHGENHLLNDMVVKEWIWEDPGALSGLAGFLRNQKDQVARALFSTDMRGFHHLLEDPRDGTGNLFWPVSHQVSSSGLGLMYRLVDLRAFLEATSHRHWGEEDLDMELELADSFWPPTRGSFSLSIRQGKMSLSEGPAQGAARVSTSTGHFSSLLMGSATMGELYCLGRVGVKPEIVPLLEKALSIPSPQCQTGF